MGAILSVNVTVSSVLDLSSMDPQLPPAPVATAGYSQPAPAMSLTDILALLPKELPKVLNQYDLAAIEAARVKRARKAARGPGFTQGF